MGTSRFEHRRYIYEVPCTSNIKRVNLTVKLLPCLEKWVLQRFSFGKPLTQLACVYRFPQTIHSCPWSQCIQMTTYFCLLPHFNSLPLSYIGQRGYPQASLSCSSYFTKLISSTQTCLWLYYNRLIKFNFKSNYVLNIFWKFSRTNGISKALNLLF